MKIYDIMPSVNKLIPFDYDKISCDEYEQIINSILSKMKKNKKIIQVSGAPGTGKTTFCHKNHHDNFLSFDNIMENLKTYKLDLQNYGSKIAFSRNEITARIIGYEILRRAIEQGLEIVLEHSGVNPAHIELFNNLKKIGYETNVCFITCDYDKTYKRISQRKNIVGRHTPKKMLDIRYGKISKYLPKYEKIADKTYIYDTSSENFILKETFIQKK